MGEKLFENLSDQNNKGQEDNEKHYVFRVGMSPSESNKKIGQIRSHLYNYAFAKSEAEKGRDSKIIFRVDDTDKSKHTKEKAEEIFKFFSDILGLQFDVTPHNSQDKIGQSVFQSERQEIYQGYLEELFDNGVAFVDKTSGLVLFDIKKFMEDFSEVIEVEDLLMGRIKYKLEENLRRGQNYFPLMRSDKLALYHLASVVDDQTFGVTHVVRGQNKISIAEFQEMVRISLGFEPKKYLHTPMLLDTEGHVLKQGAVKFDDFVSRGTIPHALISYMVSSGYGNPEEIYPSIDEFVKSFDYSKIHKSNGRFDSEKLANINKRLLKTVSPEIYTSSIFIYLAKNGDIKISDKLKKDEKLCELLSSIREKPEKCVDIIENILNPQYEDIDEDTKVNVLKIINFLERYDYVIPEAESLELKKKDLFDGLRWILVGKKTFSKIDEVIDYMRSQNLLQARVQLAKKQVL